MTMKVLMSLKDTVAGLYTSPVVEPSVESAKRQIRSELAGGDSLVAKHPEDFELWKLGSFDSETGAILSKAECVCQVSVLVPAGKELGDFKRPVAEVVQALADQMDMRSRN